MGRITITEVRRLETDALERKYKYGAHDQGYLNAWVRFSDARKQYESESSKAYTSAGTRKRSIW